MLRSAVCVCVCINEWAWNPHRKTKSAYIEWYGKIPRDIRADTSIYDILHFSVDNTSTNSVKYTWCSGSDDVLIVNWQLEKVVM